MKNFTVMKGFLSLLLITLLATNRLAAQTASISPANGSIVAGTTQSFTITTSGFGGNGNDRTYAYTITGPGATIPASPAVFNCTSGCNSESHAFQFTVPGTYTIEVTVTQDEGGSGVANASTTLTVFNPNLWSTSGTGPIRAYTVNPVTGDIINGPATIATPVTSTAALGKNKSNPNDPDGYLYYLNRDDANSLNGVVTVYSVSPTGANNGSRGTIDMNGPANNEDFSYVRLGFDDSGKGWVIAGNATNGTVYIASFQGNGSAAISNVNTFGNASLGISGGSASEFQNGDLAISGNGTLYVVANISDGSTYVYTLNSLSTPTTLTRKWTVLDQDNNNFTGSVNGVAWTQSGSLHISTSTGIYFIDQFTANTASGTVNATLVPGSTSPSGLTDLASDAFPTQTTLPVRLLTFSGTYRNQEALLNWDTENEVNFSHFEIERSTNGSVFTAISNKPSQNNSGRSAYQHSDNLATVAGSVFWYRLKIVDLDGQFKYSNVIMIRKDEKSITGITMNPNPVRGNGQATIRFTSSQSGLVTIRVLDITGRVLLQQQSKTYEGNNSVALNNSERLQPGSYVIQVAKEDEVSTAKFTVVR